MIFPIKWSDPGKVITSRRTAYWRRYGFVARDAKLKMQYQTESAGDRTNENAMVGQVSNFNSRWSYRLFTFGRDVRGAEHQGVRRENDARRRDRSTW